MTKIPSPCSGGIDIQTPLSPQILTSPNVNFNRLLLSLRVLLLCQTDRAQTSGTSRGKMERHFLIKLCQPISRGMALTHFFIPLPDYSLQ